MNIEKEETNGKKHLIGNTRCVSDFEKILEIGQGTFGTVFKARDKIKNEIIALKKVKMTIETEGFPITSLREIQILQELNHSNIIKLKEVVVGYKPDKYLKQYIFSF